LLVWCESFQSSDLSSIIDTYDISLRKQAKYSKWANLLYWMSFVPWWAIIIRVIWLCISPNSNSGFFSRHWHKLSADHPLN
jgi:hypothetical protein